MTLADAFLHLFLPGPFFIMIVGVIVGIAVGVMPGITAGKGADRRSAHVQREVDQRIRQHNGDEQFHRRDPADSQDH